MASSTFAADIRHQYSFTVTQHRLNKVLQDIAAVNINILAIVLSTDDGKKETLMVPEGDIGSILAAASVDYEKERVSYIRFLVGVPGTFSAILGTISQHIPVRNVYLTEDGGMIVESAHPDKVNQIVLTL